ncbi:MAG: hypothetical protein HY747_10160 [Elusimicrobia bacterium]|nr:hypothetical protein [Elusimicrobiota bacterium]
MTFKRLENIQTTQKSEPSPANEKELIAGRLNEITQKMTSSLEERLAVSYYFEVVPREEVRQALANLGLELSSAALTTQQIKMLSQTLHAQVLMTTKLSGYGKIKKSWVALLIGGGIVEGVVQGFIVLKVVKNDWIAAGVAAEEILQETLEWGGGAYIFNNIFTPVILEGRLISAADGQVLWKKTVMATTNRKGLKKFAPKDRKKKELRLEATYDKAQEDLIKSLESRVIKNIP